MIENFVNIIFTVKTVQPLAPKLDGCNSAHDVCTMFKLISKTNTVERMLRPQVVAEEVLKFQVFSHVTLCR